MRDTSDGFANTTQVVDRSMDIVVQLLKGGVVGKTLDLCSFLFRTHLLEHLGSLADIAEQPDLVKAKRRFMEGES